jgi:2-polyprenyl-3-methyl-5-hydroxy-6-metoxy-1,4-benzoquinol methylase
MIATAREFALSDEAFARALYRVFLFRDPDPVGFASAVRQLRSGRTLEELLTWCLRSSEFASKYPRFLETYVDARVGSAQGYNPPRRSFVPLDAPPMKVECEASASELEELTIRIAETWTSLGTARPYHSVLTLERFLPTNINNEAIEAFWATGTRESAKIRSMLAKHGFGGTRCKECVEYGCGLGRVTYPLADMFKRVYAYDISPIHLDIAKTRPNHRDIKFLESNKNVFKTGLKKCDFFYSNIVLQHNPPPLIRKLIFMALQALKPAGIAIFQVPTYAPGYSFCVREYLDRQKPSDMEMHAIPQAEVFRLIADADCRLLEVREDEAIGRLGKWVSNTFIVRKLTGCTEPK